MFALGLLGLEAFGDFRHCFVLDKFEEAVQFPHKGDFVSLEYISLVVL